MFCQLYNSCADQTGFGGSKPYSPPPNSKSHPGETERVAPARLSVRCARIYIVSLVSVFLLLVLSSCTVILPRKELPYIAYPVKSGDTLYAIALRFDVPTEEIRQLNRIRNPRNLQVGLVLKIPYRGQSLAKKQSDLVAKEVTTGGHRESAKPVNLVELGSAARQIGKLAWPVKNGRFSSRFGSRWMSFHEGIDISAKTGEPIYAAHDGKVVYSGDGLRGYGNLIVLRGADLVTVYGHNDRNRVRVGQEVGRGAHIADVGSTGKSTGPHLHFETRVKNANGKLVAVDPMIFYPGR